MLRLLVETAVLAGAGYLAGALLHELSHVLAVIATGSNLKAVRWRQLKVQHGPASKRVDGLIKATPAILSPLIVMLFLVSVRQAMVYGEVGIAIDVVTFGTLFLAGFLPGAKLEWFAIYYVFYSDSPDIDSRETSK